MTPQKHRPLRDPGPVSLLEWILEGRPNLTDAACIGAHELFDAARFPAAGIDSTNARAAATTMCRHCPASTRCPDTLTTH